jgi:hypothetical protein
LGILLIAEWCVAPLIGGINRAMHRSAIGIFQS